MKLYAYTIENENVSEPCSSFTPNLIKRMQEPGIMRDRCRELNHQTRESDLLSFYKASGDKAFGIFIRIAPQKDIASFPNNFLEGKFLTSKELTEHKNKGDGFALGSPYYFMADRRHIVTNMPAAKMSAFRAFMNWFLKDLKTGDFNYSFSSIVDRPKGASLRDIKNIIFADAQPHDPVIFEEFERTSIQIP